MNYNPLEALVPHPNANQSGVVQPGVEALQTHHHQSAGALQHPNFEVQEALQAPFQPGAGAFPPPSHRDPGAFQPYYYESTGVQQHYSNQSAGALQHLNFEVQEAPFHRGAGAFQPPFYQTAGAVQPPLYLYQYPDPCHQPYHRENVNLNNDAFTQQLSHMQGNVAGSLFYTPQSNYTSPPISSNNQTQPNMIAVHAVASEETLNETRKRKRRRSNSNEGTRSAERAGSVLTNLAASEIEFTVKARLQTCALSKVKIVITSAEVIRRHQGPENFQIEEYVNLFRKGPQQTEVVRNFLNKYGIEGLKGSSHANTSFSFLTEQECENLGKDLGEVMKLSSTIRGEMTGVAHSVAHRIIFKYGLHQLERVKNSATGIRLILSTYIKLFTPEFVESQPSFYFNIMTHGFGCHGVLAVIKQMSEMVNTLETSAVAASGTEATTKLWSARPSDSKTFHTSTSRLDNRKCDVTTGEVRRRCEGPEGMPITYLRAVLREAKNKGYSANLRERLNVKGIKFSEKKPKNFPDTLFSSLAEVDAKTLAWDAVKLLQSVRADESFVMGIAGMSSVELQGAKCFLSALCEIAGEAYRLEGPCEELITFEMISHCFGNIFLGGIVQHIYKLIEHQVGAISEME